MWFKFKTFIKNIWLFKDFLMYTCVWDYEGLEQIIYLKLKSIRDSSLKYKKGDWKSMSEHSFKKLNSSVNYFKRVLDIQDLTVIKNKETGEYLIEGKDFNKIEWKECSKSKNVYTGGDLFIDDIRISEKFPHDKYDIWAQEEYLKNLRTTAYQHLARNIVHFWY